jgi:transposase InsO family protein
MESFQHANKTSSFIRINGKKSFPEYTRECLVIHVARKITAEDLVSIMDKLIQERGVPGHIRSDNGPEFIAKILQKWLLEKKIKTLYIEPGSPWQNGHIESFNACLRDECIDREIILSLAEARVLAQDYKNHYNQQRPHGGVGYRTPAQANREARQALASSRPTDSFHQELVHSIQPAIISP